MIDLKHFVPFVTMQAETCPDFVAVPYIASAIAKICEETGCLRNARDFKVEGGTPEFIIPETDGLVCDCVLFLYVDDREMPSIRLDEVGNYYGRDWASYKGEPRCYTMVNRSKVHLIPYPDYDVSVRVVYQAAVKRSATMVPEVFFDDYRDTVVNGALSNIFRVAGQTYSNARLADACAMRFAEGLAEIHSEAANDFTRMAGSVRPNRII